ncbi:hypothetical protein [Corynebacterium renale]|uniref:hypothetical protein n=1 Tax=Corynebacterium renale TaxID=1724 RepID=UPI000E05FD19|nr:hypothetical protein [Corynebacterium renale]STC97547.1 Uncharacterised protein [Corynebacterium renale]
MVNALIAIIGALKAHVSVPVASRVPANRPGGAFIRVEAAPQTAYSPAHDRTLVIVEVYGPHTKARDVLDTVRQCRDFLRFDLPQDGGLIAWEEVTGPVEFLDPDLAATHTRWQFTGNLFTSSM